jgi:biopolymer transport protein ExbD
MEVRGRTTASIAIILILLGVGLPAGYKHWMDTRTCVALEMPVSLSPGHIRTVDFESNLAGWYQIGIAGDERLFYRQDCRFGAIDPLLKTRTTVYQNGRLLEHFEGADRFLGHFYVEKQKPYSLDIQVLTDASCLNSGRPRVFVWTASADYELLSNRLLAISVVLVLSGLGVLVFSTATLAAKQTIARDELSIVENASHAYDPSHRKRPLGPRLSRLPSFGLVYTVVLGVTLIPTFLIYLYVWGYDHRSVGIEVRLVKPVPLKAPTDSWTHPLTVRIESGGGDSAPRIYLNSGAVALEGLSPLLKAELKSRTEWVVYVEADSDVNWGDAVNAMDIIRTSGARVVLLTTPSASSRADSTRAHRY